MIPLKLEDYDVSQEFGFLPTRSPAKVQLPQSCQQLQETAALLPKLLTTGKIRRAIANLPAINLEKETIDQMQLRRLMQIYSYLTHAYVWGEPTPSEVLPRNIAVPFYQIAEQLGRPPILSYASYALDNWMRLDESEPIAIGNIMLVQNFLGGLDEDWFVLIHIDIEAKAAPVLAAIPLLLDGITRDDVLAVVKALQNIKHAWQNINETMNRMPEGCDPYIYYHRVRPYIHGWKNNPALPEGMIYEGVAAYDGEPQQFRGETGAQSAIVPTMDALFNIAHANDPLREYLREMGDYMPPKHRAFVAAVEQRSKLRDFVHHKMQQLPELKNLYNDCLSLIERFRTKHLEFAARYVHQQAAEAHNDTSIGTGGTPFMRYLKKHRDETSQHLLKSDAS
jgi:indoleamine 2,3-dioxygenase